MSLLHYAVSNSTKTEFTIEKSDFGYRDFGISVRVSNFKTNLGSGFGLGLVYMLDT
jgi:hypothetical protein